LDFGGLIPRIGETNGHRCLPFLNPIAAELDGASPELTAKALARRAKQRRQIQE